MFTTLKTCLKIGFPERAVDRFTNGFSDPKSYWDFRETDPKSSRSKLLFENSNEPGDALKFRQTHYKAQNAKLIVAFAFSILMQIQWTEEGIDKQGIFLLDVSYAS